jgi:heptosyltransferase-3
LPPHIHDITGKLSLPEFITFINLCDGIVAASTGPLHIAGALGKIALGLYPPIQPMDPLRWAPIGLKADFIVLDKNCNFCRTKPDACLCMQKILTFASKKYSAGNKQ